MNFKRLLTFGLFLVTIVLVHGNGKSSYLLRITGIVPQAGNLKVDYTNTPGLAEVWLSAAEQLRETNSTWTLIATNTQGTAQTSNSFLLSLPAGTQPTFLRLIAPVAP